jgi:hypothetical protein
MRMKASVAAAIVLLACGDGGSAGVAGAGAGGASGVAPQLPAAGEAAVPLGPRVQPTATVMLSPVARQQVDPQTSNGLPEISGMATFTATDIGVDLAVQAIGCRAFASYPLRIVDAADCAQIAGAPVWARGDGIPQVPPLPNAGLGRLNYIQQRTDAKSWTIGGDRATDILGRAFVLYDAADPARALACGLIEAGQTKITPVEIVAAERALPAAVRVALSGLCQASSIGRESTHECPDPVKAAECTSLHCDTAACVGPCAEHTACLVQQGDACTLDCPASDVCLNCMFGAATCALAFCEHVLYCAAPAAPADPGDPCGKLRECCKKQGERAEYCLNTVDRYEKISGTPTCIGLMSDLPFITNIIHDPPCMF